MICLFECESKLEGGPRDYFRRLHLVSSTLNCEDREKVYVTVNWCWNEERQKVIDLLIHFWQVCCHCHSLLLAKKKWLQLLFHKMLSQKFATSESFGRCLPYPLAILFGWWWWRRQWGLSFVRLRHFESHFSFAFDSSSLLQTPFTSSTGFQPNLCVIQLFKGM